MTHPSDALLQEFADAELPAARQADVIRHLADCAACREQISRLGQLRRRLQQIVEAPSATQAPGWSPALGRVKRRDRPGRKRFGLRVAAAALVFGVGYGAGSLRVSPGASAPAGTAEADPTGAAAAVQRIGSEYVAALAAVDTETGFEVARSTLRGAVAEVARLDGRTTDPHQPTVRF